MTSICKTPTGIPRDAAESARAAAGPSDDEYRLLLEWLDSSMRWTRDEVAEAMSGTGEARDG